MRSLLCRQVKDDGSKIFLKTDQGQFTYGISAQECGLHIHPRVGRHEHFLAGAVQIACSYITGKITINIPRFSYPRVGTVFDIVGTNGANRYAVGKKRIHPAIHEIIVSRAPEKKYKRTAYHYRPYYPYFHGSFSLSPNMTIY
jgi:hypothetical protein